MVASALSTSDLESSMLTRLRRQESTILLFVTACAFSQSSSLSVDSVFKFNATVAIAFTHRHTNSG